MSSPQDISHPAPDSITPSTSTSTLNSPFYHRTPQLQPLSFTQSLNSPDDDLHYGHNPCLLNKENIGIGAQHVTAARRHPPVGVSPDGPTNIQVPQYMNAFNGFGMSYNPMAPQSMASMEMSMRIQRIEQENMQMRQQLSDVVAQVAQLRTQGVRTSKYDELEDAMQKAVKPGPPLLPHEPPGFDCERASHAFERCHFFDDGAFLAYKKSKKGETTVGKALAKRGRPKRDGDNSESYEYLENPDGTTASECEYGLARGLAREYLDMCQEVGIALPDTWKRVDVRLKMIFYTGLRKRVTLTQLCANNSKGYQIMLGVYYDTIVRPRKKAAKNTGHAHRTASTNRDPLSSPTLDDAVYTLDDHTDNDRAGARQSKAKREESDSDDTLDYEGSGADDSESDAEELKNTSGTKPSSNAAKGAMITQSAAKRPAAESGTMPEAAKKRRTTPAISSNTKVPVLSSVAQGKRPALGGVLEDNSMAMLANEPAPDLSVAPPSPRPQRAKPTRKKGLTLVIKPTMTSPAPASASTPVSASTSGSTSASNAGPPGAPLHAVLPKTDDSGVIPTSVVILTPGDAGTSSQVESIPRKAHVRKATGWPPKSDMTGPRWDYARTWHAQNQGTLKDFEEHYTSLDKTVKNKIRAHFNKVYQEEFYLKPTRIQDSARTQQVWPQVRRNVEAVAAAAAAELEEEEEQGDKVAIQFSPTRFFPTGFPSLVSPYPRIPVSPHPRIPGTVLDLRLDREVGSQVVPGLVPGISQLVHAQEAGTTVILDVVYHASAELRSPHLFYRTPLNVVDNGPATISSRAEPVYKYHA
ncbi:hypothetical protein OH76DRAFT_1488786 [Lentinus brumalis]|uniref:Uncharacterized protein n=1 Tax=Lentinus brumalis TaxID=2498619 RepID=A0A371CPV2_9APHY|nr:hypothetical protein OH76DRAFT_1488786 [Polyporus brumalis]